MKRIILGASLVALCAMESNAYANPNVQQNIEIKGHVEPVCTATTAIQTTMTISNFTDAEGRLIPSLVEEGGEEFTGHGGSIGKVKCNYLAYVSMRAAKGWLKNGGEECNNTLAYANCISYIARLSWNGLQATVIGDGAHELTSSSNPAGGFGDFDLKLELALTGPAGDTAKPLKGGDFTETLTVKVGGPF